MRPRDEELLIGNDPREIEAKPLFRLRHLVPSCSPGMMPLHRHSPIDRANQNTFVIGTRYTNEQCRQKINPYSKSQHRSSLMPASQDSMKTWTSEVLFRGKKKGLENVARIQYVAGAAYCMKAFVKRKAAPSSLEIRTNRLHTEGTSLLVNLGGAKLNTCEHSHKEVRSTSCSVTARNRVNDRTRGNQVVPGNIGLSGQQREHGPRELMLDTGVLHEERRQTMGPEG